MAFENCTNCGAKIDCSCQYQMASDGTQCCDDCIGAYNMGLMSKKVEPKIEIQEEPIVEIKKEKNKKQDDIQ